MSARFCFSGCALLNYLTKQGGVGADYYHVRKDYCHNHINISKYFSHKCV